MEATGQQESVEFRPGADRRESLLSRYSADISLSQERRYSTVVDEFLKLQRRSEKLREEEDASVSPSVVLTRQADKAEPNGLSYVNLGNVDPPKVNLISDDEYEQFNNKIETPEEFRENMDDKLELKDETALKEICFGSEPKIVTFNKSPPETIGLGSYKSNGHKYTPHPKSRFLTPMEGPSDVKKTLNYDGSGQESQCCPVGNAQLTYTKSNSPIYCPPPSGSSIPESFVNAQFHSPFSRRGNLNVTQGNDFLKQLEKERKIKRRIAVLLMVIGVVLIVVGSVGLALTPGEDDSKINEAVQQNEEAFKQRLNELLDKIMKNKTLMQIIRQQEIDVISKTSTERKINGNVEVSAAPEHLLTSLNTIATTSERLDHFYDTSVTSKLEYIIPLENGTSIQNYTNTTSRHYTEGIAGKINDVITFPTSPDSVQAATESGENPDPDFHSTRPSWMG